MPLNPRVARTDKLHPTTRLYPLAAAHGSPRANEFVHLDASQDVIRTTAADPALLLGITEEGYDSLGVFGGMYAGFILVTVFTADLALRMAGSSNPTLEHLNKAYGIARDANGVWTVDLTDTVATRVFVIDVDLANNEFIVKILEAVRQSPE